jgi:hypothetical protein
MRTPANTHCRNVTSIVNNTGRNSDATNENVGFSGEVKRALLDSFPTLAHQHTPRMANKHTTSSRRHHPSSILANLVLNTYQVVTYFCDLVIRSREDVRTCEAMVRCADVNRKMRWQSTLALSLFHATANISSSLPHTCSAHLFVCWFHCVCVWCTDTFPRSKSDKIKRCDVI